MLELFYDFVKRNDKHTYGVNLDGALEALRQLQITPPPLTYPLRTPPLFEYGTDYTTNITKQWVYTTSSSSG